MGLERSKELMAQAKSCIRREDWPGALAALEALKAFVPDDATIAWSPQEIYYAELRLKMREEAKTRFP